MGGQGKYYVQGEMSNSHTGTVLDQKQLEEFCAAVNGNEEGEKGLEREGRGNKREEQFSHIFNPTLTTEPPAPLSKT